MAARSAVTPRARSAASLAIRSRSRRSRSALSSTGSGAGVGAGAGVGSGAGSSGAAFPPQATANAAAVKSISRDGARIITPKSWVGNGSGTPKPARPRWKPSGAWGAQLPDPTGFDIDNPDLPAAAPVGDEGHMTAIGRPGGIFVPSRRSELSNSPCRDVDQEDLGATGDLAMEHNTGPVRRPLGSVRTSRGTVVERRQQLLIGPVRSHYVQLRRTCPRGNKRDAAPIWRKRWA